MSNLLLCLFLCTMSIVYIIVISLSFNQSSESPSLPLSGTSFYWSSPRPVLAKISWEEFRWDEENRFKLLLSFSLKMRGTTRHVEDVKVNLVFNAGRRETSKTLTSATRKPPFEFFIKVIRCFLKRTALISFILCRLRLLSFVYVRLCKIFKVVLWSVHSPLNWQFLGSKSDPTVGRKAKLSTKWKSDYI